MTFLELLAAVGGGSSVTALFGYLKARRKAASNVHIAETIHDERVTPALLKRITDLEDRLNKRDEEIDTLQKGRAECERARGECEDKTRRLSEKIDAQAAKLAHQAEELVALRAEQVRLQQELHATPPGQWSPDIEAVKAVKETG